MEIVYPRCCGLDVHKKTVAACTLTAEAERQRKLQVFGTMTAELHRLRDWLQEHGVTHVAMESTGVYWKPIWNILEGHFQLLLVNPRHMKAVPGRKTDIKDCEWIAQLLQHGLLRGSFVPARATRELRDLTRTRTRLVQQQGSVANRIQKVLEDANIKLASVATDILGRSGRAMLQAMVDGEQNPEKLADLALGKLRAKIPELRLALDGQIREHHRFQLERLLRQLRFLEEEIAVWDQRIQQQTTDCQEVLQRWDTIPGVDQVTAATLVAEIGVNMKQFGAPERVASWARLCPGNQQSADKRYSGRTGKGNRWLRRILCQAAWAAAGSKGTYLSARYRRLAARRGKKRAILAVAHTILRMAYVLQDTQSNYCDFGDHYFDRLHPERLTRYHVKRLQQLGYQVQLQANTATA